MTWTGYATTSPAKTARSEALALDVLHAIEGPTEEEL